MTDYAASLVLLGAAIAAWFVAPAALPAARVHLRFAAVLFAALAASGLAVQAIVASTVLLVLPLALSVLALATAAAFARPLLPALAAALLVAACIAAFAAAFLDLRALSLAPSAIAAAALAILAARRLPLARFSALQTLSSAGCFLAGIAAAAGNPVSPAVPLFVAAGLLGLSLALARSDAGVEERPGRDLRGMGVSGGRPR